MQILWHDKKNIHRKHILKYIKWWFLKNELFDSRKEQYNLKQSIVDATPSFFSKAT